MTVSRESPAKGTRTRNEDKDGDINGKERNEEKKKEMKGCQSYTESVVRETEERAKEKRDAIAERKRENCGERRRWRSRKVLAGLKGGCEEREFPPSYIFFLVFSGVPWEKFVV